ncbi:hypothetical protein D0Y65_006105 [Glycine soja]|uniref:TIR domain-containing protein n=1 Tax=Glycine soja TaxID=3848 RepID=A0A445L7K4_GLYSO|nr:hypothetical protein D0Y65_006105 [Glycine soja]
MSSFPRYDFDLHDDEMEMDFLRERYQEDNRNYDVFLSFRGEDTRASFTSHLYTALHNEGIFVFKDDETLPRGNKISPSLRGEMKLAHEINLLVKHWREAHWELYGISGGVVLNSFVEEGIRKDFEVHVSSVEEVIRRDFELLVIHWTEALHEAAAILRFVVLNPT